MLKGFKEINFKDRTYIKLEFRNGDTVYTSIDNDVTDCNRRVNIIYLKWLSKNIKLKEFLNKHEKSAYEVLYTNNGSLSRNFNKMSNASTDECEFYLNAFICNIISNTINMQELSNSKTLRLRNNVIRELLILNEMNNLNISYENIIQLFNDINKIHNILINSFKVFKCSKHFLTYSDGVYNQNVNVLALFKALDKKFNSKFMEAFNNRNSSINRKESDTDIIYSYRYRVGIKEVLIRVACRHTSLVSVIINTVYHKELKTLEDITDTVYERFFSHRIGIVTKNAIPEFLSKICRFDYFNYKVWCLSRRPKKGTVVAYSLPTKQTMDSALEYYHALLPKLKKLKLTNFTNCLDYALCNPYQDLYLKLGNINKNLQNEVVNTMIREIKKKESKISDFTVIYYSLTEELQSLKRVISYGYPMIRNEVKRIKKLDDGSIRKLNNLHAFLKAVFYNQIGKKLEELNYQGKDCVEFRKLVLRKAFEDNPRYFHPLKDESFERFVDWYAEISMKLTEMNLTGSINVHLYYIDTDLNMQSIFKECNLDFKEECIQLIYDTLAKDFVGNRTKSNQKLYTKLSEIAPMEKILNGKLNKSQILKIAKLIQNKEPLMRLVPYLLDTKICVKDKKSMDFLTCGDETNCCMYLHSDKFKTYLKSSAFNAILVKYKNDTLFQSLIWKRHKCNSLVIDSLEYNNVPDTLYKMLPLIYNKMLKYIQTYLEIDTIEFGNSCDVFYPYCESIQDNTITVAQTLKSRCYTFYSDAHSTRTLNCALPTKVSDLNMEYEDEPRRLNYTI